MSVSTNSKAGSNNATGPLPLAHNATSTLRMRTRQIRRHDARQVLCVGDAIRCIIQFCTTQLTQRLHHKATKQGKSIATYNMQGLANLTDNFTKIQKRT